MRQTKNDQSPIRAQLTLYYQLHNEKLPIKSSEQSIDLFRQFAHSIDLFDGWFVIYLDKKTNFLCWYNLENFLDVPTIAGDIAGFAKVIKAKHVLVARLDNGNNPNIGYLDICWIAALLERCGQKHIELNDYLVITKEEWCSYQDGEFID